MEQRERPFLIIQLRPEDETADSEFEALLRYGGLDRGEVERVRAEQTGVPDVDPRGYAGIIVGGSPFDVSTPAAEKGDDQVALEQQFHRLLERVVTHDTPFLGACSGCGLLGSYGGATVSNRYPEPVGGVDVTVTDVGVEDPLLVDLPRQFRALVGHKEASETAPPGAVLLAGSATCPVQMFRYGRNVYATQFHPEGDAEGFITRINVYKHHGYFPPEQAEPLKEAVAQEDNSVPQEILRRFVARHRHHQ